MSWFVIMIAEKRSQLAHSIATSWARPEDGAAVTACGVHPFDRAGSAPVRFIPAAPHIPHCPKCQEAAA